MSLQPQKLPEIPEEIANAAKILYPKGNYFIWLRDELEAIYQDEQFASLYPKSGQPAEQPWRLALMSIIQFIETYTDRQAADAMKARVDLKYALSLRLTDPGFDFSLLSEFRSRLIKGNAEEVLLTALLSACKKRGILKDRGKQRTDSTHVEAAIRTMNRIECVGETLRAALNSLAVTVPNWLCEHTPQEWYDRYERRVEEFRMPKDATKRDALIVQIGLDGFQVLKWVRDVDSPLWLREIPAVEILRQVWIQQFSVEEEKVHWRSNENIPPASLLISSPYDIEAHMSIKRDSMWTGYKVHLTETCDDISPNLIIHVETTSATKPDMEMIEVIHQALEEKQLLPSEHFVDTGYVDGKNLVSSQKKYGVELVGPVAIPGNWQAKDGKGFDISQFQIDWKKQESHLPRWENQQYLD